MEVSGRKILTKKPIKMTPGLFIRAKRLLNRGYSQASVGCELGIGEKTMRKISRSETTSDYWALVEQDRVAKIERRKRAEAKRKLEGIMATAKYDRRTPNPEQKSGDNRIEGAAIIVLVVIGIWLALFTLIALVVQASGVA